MDYTKGQFVLADGEPAICIIGAPDVLGLVSVFGRNGARSVHVSRLSSPTILNEPDAEPWDALAPHFLLRDFGEPKSEHPTIFSAAAQPPKVGDRVLRVTEDGTRTIHTVGEPKAEPAILPAVPEGNHGDAAIPLDVLGRIRQAQAQRRAAMMTYADDRKPKAAPVADDDPTDEDMADAQALFETTLRDVGLFGDIPAVKRVLAMLLAEARVLRAKVARLESDSTPKPPNADTTKPAPAFRVWGE